jgi:hypothetical protein
MGRNWTLVLMTNEKGAISAPFGLDDMVFTDCCCCQEQGADDDLDCRCCLTESR